MTCLKRTRRGGVKALRRKREGGERGRPEDPSTQYLNWGTYRGDRKGCVCLVKQPFFLFGKNGNSISIIRELVKVCLSGVLKLGLKQDLPKSWWVSCTNVEESGSESWKEFWFPKVWQRFTLSLMHVPPTRSNGYICSNFNSATQFQSPIAWIQRHNMYKLYNLYNLWYNNAYK